MLTVLSYGEDKRGHGDVGVPGERNDVLAFSWVMVI